MKGRRAWGGGLGVAVHGGIVDVKSALQLIRNKRLIGEGQEPEEGRDWGRKKGSWQGGQGGQGDVFGIAGIHVYLARTNNLKHCIEPSSGGSPLLRII